MWGQMFMNIPHVYKADSMAKQSVLYNMNIVQPVAPDHYTSGFGFFCKQELRLEKINVPLKVRMGDPDFCNYLESKSTNLNMKK
jgi:hypothetical protein